MATSQYYKSVISNRTAMGSDNRKVAAIRGGGGKGGGRGGGKSGDKSKKGSDKTKHLSKADWDKLSKEQQDEIRQAREAKKAGRKVGALKTAPGTEAGPSKDGPSKDPPKDPPKGNPKSGDPDYDGYDGPHPDMNASEHTRYAKLSKFYDHDFSSGVNYYTTDSAWSSDESINDRDGYEMCLNTRQKAKYERRKARAQRKYRAKIAAAAAKSETKRRRDDEDDKDGDKDAKKPAAAGGQFGRGAHKPAGKAGE